MITAWIEGVGVYAPGLVGWQQAAAVLAGKVPYAPDPPPKLVPALLPADLRRRATEHIRLAVEVGAQAVQQAQADAGPLRSVFASSESDGAITHSLCEELARANPEVSPTRFHNSVNNAPAGYWCMAVQSRAPSTSVAGFDASFAVGLIEAGAQLYGEQERVLLAAHDTPLPEPLHSARPLSAIFGAALVLAPQPGARSLARIAFVIEPKLQALSRLPGAGLEGLRTGNPAARILPLLAAVARHDTVELLVPYVHGHALRISVAPA